MIYLSSLLQTNNTYKLAADRLSAALDLFNINYKYLYNTKDIWLCDFMPVKTRNSRYVSFRYEPKYLKGRSRLRTNYKDDISSQISLPNLAYSDINLDGGNAIFSPSKEKVIISSRVFEENPTYSKSKLISNLESLLDAQVIIIPSLSMRYDMTGHADGMVRFVNEHTVAGNRVKGDNRLEKSIKVTLKEHSIDVIDFPYFQPNGISAKGCYLNYLETDEIIFLPVFNNKTDDEAVTMAENIFAKQIAPVNINEIAQKGGVLNCISWEME